MKITQLAVVSLFTAGALVTGCKKKEEAATDKAAKPTEAQPAADTKPADTKPTEAPPEAKAAPAELVEHDLSAFGPQFKGVVVMAPKTAKIEFDDPSRHIVLSDVDFVSISEAPYWEDGVKSLSHHEYEFKSKEDLRRFLAPHFACVTVFETKHPGRHNLYFWASDGVLPFQPEWPQMCGQGGAER